MGTSIYTIKNMYTYNHTASECGVIRRTCVNVQFDFEML